MSDQQLSYCHGGSEIPLLYETIGVRFDASAVRWPDSEALVVCDQGVRLTFSELKREVDRLATGLLAHGLRPGDSVGIWSPNNAAWVVTQYATAKAGLIMVNVNPAYRITELEYALNKVACRALITADRFKTRDYLGMLREPAPEIDASIPEQLRSARLPYLQFLIHLSDADEPGFLPFDEVLHLGGVAEFARLTELAGVLQPDDPINIQFTSGTTGSPKAATLTRHNILNNAFFQGGRMGVIEGDRYCMPLPLYHCGGMVCGSLVGLAYGATMIYPGEGFDTLAMLEALQNERCTVLGAVPTVFIAMLNHPDFTRFDVSRLRKGFIGGAPSPVEVMRRLIDEVGMQDITIIYGMTEMSPVRVQTSRGDTLEQRTATVGRVHPRRDLTHLLRLLRRYPIQMSRTVNYDSHLAAATGDGLHEQR